MFSYKQVIFKLNPQDNITVKEKFTVAIGALLLHDYNVMRTPPGFRKSFVALSRYLVFAKQVGNVFTKAVIHWADFEIISAQ